MHLTTNWAAKVMSFSLSVNRKMKNIFNLLYESKSVS